MIYVSSSSGGIASGILYGNKDILSYHTGTDIWSTFFDGSDVGLTSSGVKDVDAFHRMPDGSLLLSFFRATNTPDVGWVDDSDIVRFIPTSLGNSTTGIFEMYFDGSDVGLTTNEEDVDAIFVQANGDLLISVSIWSQVPGLSDVKDEDLIRFTPTSLGNTTSGSWDIYFDGSDVGLNNTDNEDIWGVWVDETTGEIYLTTRGKFSVPSVNGNSSDIFICDPTSLGASTSCTFSSFWSGRSNGFRNNRIDGIHITN